MPSHSELINFKDLVGNSYTLSNEQFESQRSVNLYVEYDEMLTTGKNNTKHLAPTPGLILATNSIPGVTGVSRGKYTTTRGHCISIFGNKLYQITGNSPPFTYTLVGTILTNTGIISQLAFADDGTQLVFTDGTYGYFANISSSIVTTLTRITDPFFESYGPTSCCQYYDTFFIFNITGTNQFFWSNQAQLTFDPSGITSAGIDAKTGNTDPIKFLCVINRYLWLVGFETTEIWYDTPSNNFVFQRIQGPYMELGCIDGNTAQKTESGLVWLAHSLRGNLQVVMTNGESTVTISTQAVSLALSKYSNFGEQPGWSSYAYGDRGHLFYVLNPPQGTSSWVYDFPTSILANQLTWHERTYTTPSTGIQNRALPNNHAYYKGYHLLGDYNSVNDYCYDYNTFTDNGAPITRERLSPYISNNMQMMYHDLFQLDCKTGTATINEAGSNYKERITDNNYLRLTLDGRIRITIPAVAEQYVEPQVGLRYSDDGNTYSQWIYEKMGGTGQFFRRMQYWQLGLCETGYRLYHIKFTDPTYFDLIGAKLKLTEVYEE